jgi:hypothetical protein
MAANFYDGSWGHITSMAATRGEKCIGLREKAIQQPIGRRPDILKRWARGDIVFHLSHHDQVLMQRGWGKYMENLIYLLK